MDAQIAIPDLDDDTIYNINGDDSATFATNEAPKARPFRGAELYQHHSRSGSAVSADSSSGSRGIGGGPYTAGGSSGSASRLFNASNSNLSTIAPPSFPRKSSFASLKAAFKGQGQGVNGAITGNAKTGHEVYPSQLRDPFHHSGSTSDLHRQVNPADVRMHTRDDSIGSSTSRNRMGFVNIPSNPQARHMYQNSLLSDQSIGLTSTLPSSLSESAGIPIVGGLMTQSQPPVLDPYTGGSAPPAKTAYARSLSNRAYLASSSVDDIPLTAPLPITSSHGRAGSNQSSLDPHGNRFHYTQDSLSSYLESDEPLLPPQLPFAGSSWQHGRGPSGGTLAASEEGERSSSEHINRGGQTPMAPTNQQCQHHHQTSSLQSRHTDFSRASDHLSHATLPSGVGLEDPVTPSEFAINVLCSRFVTLAGVRVRGAMGGVDESDPILERILGPKADHSLDALLDSLAQLSKRNTKLVVDSLFRWRVTLLEEKVNMGEVRGALAGSQAGLHLGVSDIANVLMQRKTLSTTFLLCRALSQVASHFAPGVDGRIGGLSDKQSNELQDATFELMKDCSRERIQPSRMQAEAFDAATRLLGVLSKSGFTAIGERYLHWLQQCQKMTSTSNSSSKEGDPAIETVILAMGHLHITPYPMELFEEGAEFLAIMAKQFASAHGQRIKSAYADAMTRLLLPVAKSATAELHHPTWIKALDIIAPRAFAMLSKPRYWTVAYPLYVAILCVSPEDKFLASSSSSASDNQGMSWFACLESGVARLNKDRSVRSIVLNAGAQLLWTYIFRCRESSTTTFKRLESFFRIWFPQNRTTIIPQDSVNLQSHIILVHLVLYRHFEFGRDLILDLMRYTSLSGKTLALQPEILLSKQRMTIAIRAILVTLDALIKSELPSLPLEVYKELDSKMVGDEIPDTFTYPRPEIEKSQLQFNDLIGKIAILCDHQVGSITVFDEQVTLHRGLSVTAAMATLKNSGDDEKFSWKAHHDAKFVASYNKDHQGTMDLLRACFDSWPRCLSSSIPFATVLSALYKAHFSADPQLADAASKCLLRIAKQKKGGANAIVNGFMRNVLRQEMFCWEHHPSQLTVMPKVEQSIRFWIEVLEIWLEELKKSYNATFGQGNWEMERVSAWPIIDEVEALGLFLLCSAWRPLRRRAVGVLRMVAKLDELFVSLSTSSKNPNFTSFKDGVENGIEMGGEEEEEEPTRIIHLLDLPSNRFNEESRGGREDYFDPLKALERAKTRKWKRSRQANETLGELAASEKTNESSTWFIVIPKFLRSCLEYFPTTIAVFRSFVTTRVVWMESAVSMAAGTSNRFNTTTTTSTTSGSTLKGYGSSNGVALTFNADGSLSPEQSLMAEHWKMYILSLCTCTTSIEGQNRSSKGETAASGDRVFAAKDLFQKLVPFMASDHARFRDAVVSSLGNININLYKTLLETMQTVSAQLREDFKTTRSGSRRSRRHERLRTAVAHVIQLTCPHMIKVMPDSTIVFLLLQWIKETFNFLTDKEIRNDWEFHRLRRFFAGVVEEFFNCLHGNISQQDASEKYLTFETKLRMFRLFREWHSFSQAAKDGPAKLANLLATVAEQYREDSKTRENILTVLRNETQLLSFQASSAMAALCQGVITLVGSAVPAPMSGSHLDTDSLLEWLHYLFLSPSPQNHSVARRALKALLMHNISHQDLITKTSHQAFSEAEQTTASRSFFAVLSEVLIDHQDGFILPLEQILCLSLIKLGHSDSVMRKKAFTLLSSISSTRGGKSNSSLYAYEGGVSSPLPATYLRAQRDVSTFLADQFYDYKVAMLCEYTLRLPSIDLIRRATTLGLLPEWLHQIDLVEQEGYDSTSVILPKRTMLVLSNLLSLTIKYGDEHNFEIQDTWASLAEGSQYAFNASIVIKFLIQQALLLRSTVFITHAKRAISCLSHTVLAPSLFSKLCSYIDPSSMIPVPLELESMSLLTDSTLDHLYMANIELLLPPPSRKQTYSPGQVALLFVGELTYDKSYLLEEKLPLLLHVIFMNIDSLNPFTQEQILAMFEQLLRSLCAERGSNQVNSQVEQFFTKRSSIIWTHDDIDIDLDTSHTPRTMKMTILETLSILRDISPTLNEQWGNVALYWATSNPVRHMACRSFQAFRILLPKINYTMLADMLGRLSNTISDSTRIDNQTFALEILYTLKAIVQNLNMDTLSLLDRQVHVEMLCHIFWMNVACLSTVNEGEFIQSIALFHVLLDHLEMDSNDTVQLIKSKCPDGWEGEMGGLQNLIMRGLKSGNTFQESFRLLCRLTKNVNDELIEHHESRLGYLFLGVLPWFLQMTDEPNGKDEKMVIELAQDISILAGKYNNLDLQRVTTSIAKKRFRTKDDLIRQAINCCTRSGFLPNHVKGITLLLLSLTFNSQEWLQKQVLQILKLFFQVVDTKREDFYLLGSELLMPLLRLLNTNLSLQALEVLDENIVLMGGGSNSTSADGKRAGGMANNGDGGSRETRSGPSAQQILRMSLQWGKPNTMRKSRNNNNNHNNNNSNNRMQHTTTPSQGVNEINSLFGQPEESGWSVSNIQDYTTRTRINILSVFKSVELLLDTPPVGEVNFVDEYDADENVFETTLTVSRNEMEEEADEMRIDENQRPAMKPRSNLSNGDEVSIPPSANSIHSMDQGSMTDLGDIVNQLHDLSSFFVDDYDPNGLTRKDSTRYAHTIQSSNGDTSTSSHEQIAKILSRRAMNAFNGLQGGGYSGGGRGSSTPNGLRAASSSIAESQSAGSLKSNKSNQNGDDSSLTDSGVAPTSTISKRSGVWSRKSLFGSGKRGTIPSSANNANARTTPTADSYSNVDARSDYFDHPDA